ncbi:MAG: ABC transporter permease subunit [Clostridiales bacterium]|nr:ABC transporter permease subunit [Clostridiales bacterium]
MWLIWIVAYYVTGNKLIVPAFSDTAQSFFNYLISGEFWSALLNTFLRTLLSFIISFILATACAVLAKLNRCAKAFLNPVIVFVRTLPTLAVILIILKLTSNNRSFSPVIVTILVLFPMIFSQMLAAADGIDSGLVEMAKVYKIGKRDRLFKIYLPLVAPNIISQTGANISLGLKIMISAEVLANTVDGLGGMMQFNSIAAEVANLAALTLAAVAIGLIIEFSISFISRFACRWNKKEGGK